MSLGSYIKEKREEQQLSQRDLANACGLSNAEISRIESGLRKQPSPLVIKKIADALHIPAENLFVEAGVLERGKEYVAGYLDKNGDKPIISPDFKPSDYFKDLPYITVDDLTPDEIEDVKKYILFIKSRRSI